MRAVSDAAWDQWLLDAASAHYDGDFLGTVRIEPIDPIEPFAGAAEEEAVDRPSPWRALGSLMWILIAVAITVGRACSDG